MITIRNAAACLPSPGKPWIVSRLAGLGVVAALTGCQTLAPPAQTVLYDLGPPPMAMAAASQARLPLALAEVEVGAAFEGRGIVYRLLYAEPNRLHVYALSRWSAPPSQLLGQRLRERLGTQWVVLTAGEGPGLPRGRNQTIHTLYLSLEDFSHVFEAPQRSQGRVRLRATLVEATPIGDRLIDQRLFEVQRTAATPDAAGGAAALAAAVDQALSELEPWLARQR